MKTAYLHARNNHHWTRHQPIRNNHHWTRHQLLRNNHHWTHALVLRATLATFSLASFLLAAGAQSHWR